MPKRIFRTSFTIADNKLQAGCTMANKVNYCINAADEFWRIVEDIVIIVTNESWIIAIADELRQTSVGLRKASKG